MWTEFIWEIRIAKQFVLLFVTKLIIEVIHFIYSVEIQYHNIRFVFYCFVEKLSITQTKYVFD